MTFGKMLISHILAVLAFIFSVIGALTGKVDIYWVIAVTLLGVALSVAAFIIDYRTASASVKVFKDKKGRGKDTDIADYMKRLIGRASSVAIFTRDMTWVTPEITGILNQKASDDGLTIVMQSSTNLSEELEQKGARIYYYGSLMPTTMRSRFTLINADSQSVEIAIGRSEGEVHRIQHFGKASDPALTMGTDMLDILRAALPREEVNRPPNSGRGSANEGSHRK